MDKVPFYNKYKYEFRALFAVLISSFSYAFAIKAFIQGSGLLTGGVAGISLIISRKFFELNQANAFSIIYVLLNLPLFVLSYKGLGKLFTFFTILNVVLSSVLIAILPLQWFEFLIVALEDDLMAKTLCAAVLSGVGTGVALRYDTSAGGIDILGAYISLKKGTKIGKTIFILNSLILIVGGLLFHEWRAMIYTIIYFFATSLVANVFHIRHNKKLIKIITNKKDEVSSILVKNSFHGCTIMKGVGAYTHQERYIVETVVSEEEVKRLLNLIYQADKDAFTTISNVDMVKGRFYYPPIR